MLVASGQIEYAAVIAAMQAMCFEEAWGKDAIQTLLQLPTTIAWVHEQGFLLCSRVLDEIEILTVGVLPAYQRQGIASRLLAEMIDWAKQNQIAKVFLEVSAENRAAQKLYSKTGFCQTGIRHGYYQTKHGPIDAICMTKKLSGE